MTISPRFGRVARLRHLVLLLRDLAAFAMTPGGRWIAFVAVIGLVVSLVLGVAHLAVPVAVYSFF